MSATVTSIRAVSVRETDISRATAEAQRRLRAMRLDLGLTQEQVGKLCGVRRVTVTDREHNGDGLGALVQLVLLEWELERRSGMRRAA